MATVKKSVTNAKASANVFVVGDDPTAPVTRAEFAEFAGVVREIISQQLAEFVANISTELAALDSRLSRLEGAEEPADGSVAERVERLEHVAGKWNSADLQEFDKRRAIERGTDKSV